MNRSLVFTFIGPDQPGLVEKLSQAVASHGGNWLESRMSQLAGQFAGIVRIAVNDEQLDSLAEALLALSGAELTVTVQRDAGSSGAAKQQTQRLSIIGNDRPGIVKEVARALAARHINVCEMSTNITSAPMTAEALFEAEADIELPASVKRDELQEQLDAIADQLSVDIKLE